MRLLEPLFVSIISGIVVSFVMISLSNMLKRKEQEIRRRQEAMREEKVVIDIKAEKVTRKGG